MSGRSRRPAIGAELTRRLLPTSGAELLLRRERTTALRAELPARLPRVALGAYDRSSRSLRVELRLRLGCKLGLLLLESSAHGLAHADADRHLRAHPGDASAHAVLGHPLPGSHHRLPGGVVLVVAGELLDVARLLVELLIVLELLLLYRD